MVATAEKLVPVLGSDARTIPYVNDAKHYTCTLQLGASHSWRHYRPGAWVRDPVNDNGDSKAYKHVSAMYTIGSIPGLLLNGMISEHNKWVQESGLQSVRGRIQYIFLVGDIKEAEKAPTPLSANMVLTNATLIEAITLAATAAATAAVEAVLGAEKKSAK